jgi:hypothetical protein
MIAVGEAKRIAKEWVEAEAPNISNFQGAFLVGSLNFRKQDEPLPPTSDVDVRIVVDFDNRELIYKQGLVQQILMVRGIKLDTGFDPIQEFITPEQVLSNFIYASNFSVPNILSDPTGKLTKLQKAVAEQFASKKWVTKRIEGASGLAQWGLDGLQSGSFIDRMLALWYAMNIASLPLQADLRPPTIRKGVIVFLDVMEAFGRHDLHESLLKLYGSQSMTRVDVEMHLEDLSNTFDRVIEIVQSPSFGDFINPIARSIVIDGSWEMVNDGFHREAMIWIGSMRTICQKTILRDAHEEEQMHYVEQYQKLLADMGLHSEDDFQKRAEYGALLLDEVMQVAEQIVETNEKIIN